MIGDGFNRRDFLKYAGIGSLATNSMSDLVEKRSDAAQVDTQSITGPSQSVTIIPGEDQDLTLIPNLEVAVTILIELESESFTWGDTLATGDAGFEIKYTGFELQGSDTDGPFEINSSSSPLDIKNTEEIEAPEQHGITLFLEPTDDDLAEIEVTSPKQDIELPSVSYNIESDPEPSWEYFANIAARRSELFNNYIEAYEGVVAGQAWEQHFAEETADIITTLAVDKSISLATSGVAGLLDSDWLEVAELAYGLRNGLTNTTIARAVKSSFDLAHDQIDHSHRQAVECAGSSDEFLGEVKNLCEQEETAWRNRDRAEVIATLEEQRAELFDTSTSGESLFQEARYQANYRSNWGRECSAFAFGGDTENEVRDFFGMVRDFAQDEDKNVADTLRFVRPPNPSVSANRRPEKISARLRDLATGEEDRVKVDFEVSNGSGAGLSSIEGYLSVSYSEYLSVRVESDDEIDTIIHSPDDGSTIIDREGNEITPEYPLLDVFGQYEPGETRIITVAFETEKEEEVDEEDVWFQYRSALQPLLTAEEPGTPASQAEFERAPDPETGNGFKEDQQGWPARQITAEDAAYPPAARFRVEPTQVAVDEEITLDASESSAEGPIEAYSWDVDTTDDGDFDESYEGETVSVSFANSGRKRVRLTVEDANEETQPVSDTAEITVDPAPPDIVADYTTRPTTPSVDDEVSFISTVDADSYEWEINGTEYTGQTVTETFSSAGEYDVSHRVGRAGDSDEITSVLTVENVEERLGSPRARIDAPRSLEDGEEGTFDASDSYHPNDELSIDSYEWEIGGEEYADVEVTHSFTEEGEYDVSVAVVDEKGLEDTAVGVVSVTPSTGTSTGNVTGEVTEDGEPVVGLEVTIMNLDNNVISDSNVTDSNGVYKFDVGHGSYKIVIDSDGYMWSSDEIVVASETHIKNISLTDARIAKGPTVYFGSSEGTNTDSGAKFYAVDATSGELSWAIDTPHFVETSPISVDGYTYFGSDSGFFAIDGKTGETNWTHGRFRIRSSPTLVDGNLFYGDRSSSVSLYAIDAQSGEEKWTYDDLSGWLDTSAAVSNGMVYITSNDGNLHCIDQDTGEQVWVFQTTLDRPSRSSPTVFGDSVFYIGPAEERHQYKLYSIHAKSGELIWSAKDKDESPGPYSTPVIYNKKVYVTGTRVYAFDIKTGESIWVQDYSERISHDHGGLTISGDYMYVITQNKLLAVDHEDGEEEWEFEVTDDEYFSKLTEFEGSLFVTSSKGTLYAINSENGEVEWIFDEPKDSIKGAATVVPDPSDGNSGDSRVLLGTAGHHDGWASEAAKDGVIFDIDKPIIGNFVPKDLDDDGLYEDVNGDGSADVVDVQTLHRNLDSNLVQSHSEAFNFAEDNPEEVTQADVAALYDRVTGGDSDE